MDAIADGYIARIHRDCTQQSSPSDHGASRLLILGASGDLTRRHLLPAIAELVAAGHLPQPFDVTGIALDPWDSEQFRAHATLHLEKYAPNIPRSAHCDTTARLNYVAGDVRAPDVLRRAIAGADGPVLAYLALPPALFLPAARALSEATGDSGTRVVVEKPFGSDLGSAMRLNEELQRCFGEQSVSRIDHFLQKQTVQNIVGLRFANRLFESLWSSQHIERVDILWDETIALEGRAGYYDHTGALRDMVHNHLLQLACLVAMEQPRALTDDLLRDAKVRVLEAVRPLDDEAIATSTVRARYTAGSVDGRAIPDYTAEPDVDAGRETETFAEVTMFIDNERWHGVPFRLRTGKGLARATREIRIQFRPVQAPLFETGTRDEPRRNQLTMTVDPDRLSVDIAVNGGGDPFCLDSEQLDLALAPQELSAYARVLMDAIEGDTAWAIRGDEAEHAWRFVEPILKGWREGLAPMQEYAAGSSGPTHP